jgi:ParB-like chromosome segregation protein Spo0J
MITSRAAAKIVTLGLKEEQVFAGIPVDLLLSLSDVSPNDYNPKSCNDERILMLANSVKMNGWIPSELPLVWEDKDGPTRYTIINGEHRWLICKEAGFSQYPAVVASAIETREEAMALTMALEEARARRDAKQYTANLLELAAKNRDELLTKVLRQRDPEELRRLQAAHAEKSAQTVATAKEKASQAPRLMTLTFTRAQSDAYHQALGKARTRLKQAQETVNMLEELSNADVVAIAAVLRNAR